MFSAFISVCLFLVAVVTLLGWAVLRGANG